MTVREQHRAERREDLLAVALAEFNEKGFHGASTRSITSRAGISSGLLFHYFESKEALYVELVRRGFARMDVDVDGALSDPAGHLHCQAAATLDMLRDNPGAAAMFVFMTYAELHPGIDAEVDDLFATRELATATVPVIEAGQRQGLFRDGDPRALALAFWSALQGVAEAVAADPDAPLPEAAWLTAIVRKEG